MECEIYKLVPANAPSKRVTLQEVIQVAVRDGKAVFPIIGDCMEGRDIMNGGWVAVDFTHYPRPGRKVDGKYISGDPCMCYASFPSKGMEPEHPPAIMCKEYDGVWLGHMVGTRYRRTDGKIRMNCGFPAIAILGVIFASWSPDGELLWETDPDDYPTELPTEITIKGENIEPLGTLVKTRRR